MMVTLFSVLIGAMIGASVWSVREIRSLRTDLVKLRREHETLRTQHFHLSDAFREHLRKKGVHDDDIDAMMRMMAPSSPPAQVLANAIRRKKIAAMSLSAPPVEVTPSMLLSQLWDHGPDVGLVNQDNNQDKPAPAEELDEPTSIFD